MLTSGADLLQEGRCSSDNMRLLQALTFPVVIRVLLGYMYMRGRHVALKNSSVWRSSSGRMGCSKFSSGARLSEDPGTYGTITNFLLISQYACTENS